MKLPKVVKLGTQKFRVEVFDSHGSRERDAVGQTNSISNTIFISDELAPEAMASTLMHEVIHAMCATSGIRHTITHDEEEAFAHLLSEQMCLLIRDNFELLKNIKGVLS